MPCFSRGFTQVELVMVIIILGILAVVALPYFSGASTFKASALSEQVRASLRYAQKTAVSHRRLVCATLGAATVTLTIASVNSSAPATSSCDAALKSPTGATVFVTSSDPANMTISVAPSGTIYFQPSGFVTSDGAGTTIQDYTITVSGMPPISVVGATGYVN
jgi:prepilin-type N-terminal cleavage/methylation domain-containing protein